MSKRFWICIGGILFVFFLAALFFFSKNNEPRTVSFSIEYNGSGRTEHLIREGTLVEDAVKESGYNISSDSFLFPERGNAVSAGTNITIHSAKEIIVKERDSKNTFTVSGLTVQEALEEAGVTLVGADFVKPSLETALLPNMIIEVTRVTVTEENEEEKIPFEKVEVRDENVSFRIQKITQKGEPGVRITRYKVSRHNDSVVAKEKIETLIAKEPVEEKTTIGTKVTVVKKHSGGASWYTHTGNLSAANPWLPLGSFVRVTNMGNGKSVIVKINDRGPFGAGRIIDLDKVAFEKIADLGTGVINVLMEEIK